MGRRGVIEVIEAGDREGEAGRAAGRDGQARLRGAVRGRLDLEILRRRVGEDNGLLGLSEDDARAQHWNVRGNREAHGREGRVGCVRPGSGGASRDADARDNAGEESAAH